MKKLLQKPQFRQNDRVVVSGLEGIEGWKGTIVGMATENIIDLWLVDFGKEISTTYPYSVCTVPHVHLELDKEKLDENSVEEGLS